MEPPNKQSRSFIAILIIAIMDVLPILMLINGGQHELEKIVKYMTGIRFSGETFLIHALLVFCLVSIPALFWICRSLTTSSGFNTLIAVVLSCVQGVLAFFCIMGLSFRYHP